MKYNNIIKCALPVVAGVLATACTFQQEDLFDESAALRVEHTNKEISKYLSEAPYGWVIQYYVAGTDEENFEGFNLFGRFTESGSVTLGGDHRFLRNGKAGTYTEHTSVYEMLREESCVLSFSTWNDILSVFVDPVNPNNAPNMLIDDGEGMHGDDRLVMLSYGPDEMEFRGERHGAHVRFAKLDCEPQEYLAKVKATKEAVTSSRIYEYQIANSEQVMYIANLNTGVMSIRDRLDDPLVSIDMPCVFTPTGFRTEHVFELGGEELQEFVLNDDQTALVCGNTLIHAEWERAVPRFLTGNKAMITDQGASPAFATLYNSIAESVVQAYSSQSFTGISFGPSNEGASKRRVGLVFNMKTTNNLYQVAYTATTEVKDGKLTIVVDTHDTSSNYATYNKKGLGPVFDAMAEAISGTYTITPDNPFRLNEVKAVKDSDPGFYFVLNM